MLSRRVTFCLTSLLWNGCQTGADTFTAKSAALVDTRKDFHEVAMSDPALGPLDAVRSVAAIFLDDTLNRVSPDVLRIMAPRLSDRISTSLPWCPDVRFLQQPSAALCTAFLVEPDVVATATRCLETIPCARMQLVFDYALMAPTDIPLTPSTENVFRCSDVLTRGVLSQDLGYSLLRLNRAALGRPPLQRATERDAALLNFPEALILLSHPAGLPLKVVKGRLRAPTGAGGRLWVRLETGTSTPGAPVFAADSKGVVGLTLGSGGEDFSPRSMEEKGDLHQCLDWNSCTDDDCPGEQIAPLGHGPTPPSTPSPVEHAFPLAESGPLD